MIEFRDGEKWCRWNGTLMSPKNCKKLFGVDGEIAVEKDFIDDGRAIYTDKPIGKILAKLGEKFEDPGEYDDPSGYGWKDYTWEKRLAGKIAFDLDFIKGLVVKPLAEFRKTYPYFNEKVHNAFYDELNEYYDKMIGRK